MSTITIPKTEYQKLKQQSSLFAKIAEEIAKADFIYPYDYKYIDKIEKKALLDFKKGKCVKANSIDSALIKFGKNK